MVAAVCGWHVRHAVAAAEIERRLDRGERMAIAARAIAETYAVLTRLPPPTGSRRLTHGRWCG